MMLIENSNNSNQCKNINLKLSIFKTLTLKKFIKQQKYY